MAVLDLKNNGVKDIEVAYKDRLWLNFIDAGYFCCSKKYRDDFLLRRCLTTIAIKERWDPTPGSLITTRYTRSK